MSIIDWIAEANALQPELVTRRRDLHQHPELAFQEVRTAGIVAQALNELGIEVTTGVGKTGVVGVLEGAQDGPTILVRCDMDALPIHEQNQVEYVSVVPNKMHACGHDGHTAIGLSVAKLLTQHRDQIAGRVKFLFQPAEEIGQGARAMIADGALKSPRPDAAVGLHLWSELPIGTLALTNGPFMAGSGIFTITVIGSGGHAAIPNQTRDPVVAGAAIVSALQTIISRNLSNMDTGVVSVTMFHAGEASNVIPNTAVLQGTLRSFRQSVYDLLARRLTEIATGVAQAYGCEVKIDMRQDTPPLVNDLEVYERVSHAFAAPIESLGLTVRDGMRTMTAEDMSVLLEEIPGVFFFVGAANEAKGITYPHHHPRFDIDEAALPIGVALLCTAVAEYVMPAARVSNST